MVRIAWMSALALLLVGCVSAPRVGEPLGAASDCASTPLGFAVIDGKTLHSCPYVRSTNGSYGAFDQVDQGVVRAVLDRPAARAWIISTQCAALGAEAGSQHYGACEKNLSEIF